MFEYRTEGHVRYNSILLVLGLHGSTICMASLTVVTTIIANPNKVHDLLQQCKHGQGLIIIAKQMWSFAVLD